MKEINAILKTRSSLRKDSPVAKALMIYRMDNKTYNNGFNDKIRKTLLKIKEEKTKESRYPVLEVEEESEDSFIDTSEESELIFDDEFFTSSSSLSEI